MELMMIVVIIVIIFSCGFTWGRKEGLRTARAKLESMPVRAMPLEALALKREQAKRTIEKLRKVLQDFPEERDSHWYNAVETMRAMGFHRIYLTIELCLELGDPLYEWVQKHTIPDEEHIRVDNRFWSNIDPLYSVMPAQRRIWIRDLRCSRLDCSSTIASSQHATPSKPRS